MNSSELTEARDRRLHGTRAAALVGLIGRRHGVSVDHVSWDALSSLPSWCLLSVAERQRLQSVCGVIYLKPLIQSSVDGEFLREIYASVGELMFTRICSDTKSEQRENIVLPAGEAEYSVMEYGVSVLLATLDDNNLRKLFKCMLGDSASEIESEAARDILVTAYQLAEDDKTGVAITTSDAG